MQSSAAEAATKLPSDEHLKEPETNAEAVESNETVELTSAEEGAIEAVSAEALLSESSEEKESSEDSEDQKKQVRFADPLHIVINYMQYPERFITIKPVSVFLTPRTAPLRSALSISACSLNRDRRFLYLSSGPDEHSELPQHHGERHGNGVEPIFATTTTPPPSQPPLAAHFTAR